MLKNLHSRPLKLPNYFIVFFINANKVLVGKTFLRRVDGTQLL